MGKTAVLDLAKVHREEYKAHREPALMRVGPGDYLAISGQGAPGGDVFQQKLQALYGVAWTIRMTRKFSGTPSQDYKVGALEAVWHGPNGEADFSPFPRDLWCWTLLVRIPEFIKGKDLNEAVVRQLEKRKGPDVRDVSIQRLEEGLCVQTLHVGPYDRETETIQRMKEFAAEKGLEFHGRHHEIYLSDPRRTASERLRTILRMPVRERR